MNFRRIFSLFLALLMTVSTFAEIIPANAIAAETTDTAETAESTSDVVASYEIPLEEVTFGEDGSMHIDLSDFIPTTTESQDTEPVDTESAVTESVVTEPVVADPESTEPAVTEPETTEPETTEPETTEPETVLEPLTWFQWIEEKGVDTAALSKEEFDVLSAEYSAYRINTLAEMGELPEGATAGTVANDYIEVSVGSDGLFTIGTRLGNPNYSSDDNKKLLYGHPNPWSSQTLIYIDGSYQNFFYADTISYSYNTATATMSIPSYGIKVVQTLKLIKVGSSSFEDTVQIQYQVYNNDDQNHDVGVRIMIDTMLANNDAATYHLTSLGHVTTARVFSGSAIPSTYQFYDNIQNPTTMATGYLYRSGDRKPDKVQFCNWGGINGSSWNHTVHDGDTLGDSAVGVYFNPVTIKTGKNTTVRTYYGVSIGTASGDSTEVDSDEVKLIVKDSFTQEPLEGVAVSYKIGMEDTTRSATTDSDGIAILSGFDNIREPVSTSITLTKDGYKRSSFRTNLRGGATSTQQMSREDAPKPVINTITLDTGSSTVNLLDSTYSFDEDPNDFITKNGATGTVTIKATADVENCTWYLVQNAKVLQRNSTGEFTFNVRKTTVGDEEKVLIEDLTPNGTRYIYCVSPEGEKSEQMRFGLKVRAGTEVKFGDFDLGKVWPSVDGSLVEGSLGALFLGNKLQFGPKDGNYTVFAELTEDGVVRVGVNVDVKDLGKINEIENGKPVYKDRKEDILESLRQEMMDFSTGKNKKLKNTVAKPGNFSYGIGEATFVFCGYGEGQLENGSVRVDVTMFFAVKATGSNTWQFLWGAVPVYIDVGGEVGAKLQASANIMNTEGLGFRFYEAAFNPSVKVWLEGGMGVKKVASVGVQGSGTLNANWDLLNQSLIVNLEASAALVAEAFGIFEKDLTFAKTTVPIYDSNDKEGTTAYGGEDNLFELLDEQPYRLITREESAEGGTSQYATNASIVTVNGVQYKFFATDRGGDLSNRYMLCWSKLENGTWTEAVPVADDGTSDLYYDVAVSGSNLYVVWSNSGSVFNDDTVTLDEFAAAQEICLAVIDSTNGTVTAPLKLTDDDVMDTMPAVTVLDGTAYVAWSHTANSMEEMTDVYDNYLYYTTVTGGSAGQTVSVNFEKASVNSVSASAASGKPLATVVTNASDEDTVEENETTVVDMSSGTKTEVDTTDKIIGKTVSGTIDGVEKVFWMENGNVAYADSITSENPTYIFTEETIPGTITEDNYTVISASGSTYLIWSQSSSEEGVPAVAMTTIYSNGAWGSTHKLTDLCTGDITKLDGYLNADGKLVLVYTVKTIHKNAAGNTTVTTESRETIVEPEQSVRFASLDFNLSEAIPGQILPLKLDVVNTGNTTVDSLDIYINSEAGENYRSTLVGLGIAPGTSSVIEIGDFALSDKLTTRTHSEGQYIYTVTANATGSEITAEEIFEIGYDKVMIYKRDTAYVDNRENAVIVVENVSGFPATNVRVQILADAVDGVLIYDKTFDEIGANDRKTIYLSVEELDSTSLFAAVSTDCTAGLEREYTELILSNPSTMAKLTMETIGHGTATPAGENMFEIGAPVTIQATAEEGYLFDGWYSNRKLVYCSGNEDSAQAEIEMPDVDTILSARFVSEIPHDFTLGAAAADMYVGEQFLLAANFASLEESGKILWSSSDETVATVSTRGLITGLSAGTAEITATCGEYVHTCQITVSYVDVTDIRMVYPTLNLPPEETAAAEVLTEPENGIHSLLWTSSDETVATVDQQGNVTALAYGTAVITAAARTNPEVTAQCTVNVILPVEDIALDQYEISMNLVNNQAQLKVLYEPAEANYGKRIVWSVDNPEILELAPGGAFGEILTITAVRYGHATITATTEDGYQVSCMVNIQDVIRAETVEELQSAHYPYETNVDRTWIYTDETKDFLIARFSPETEIHTNDELQVLDADGNVIASSTDVDFGGRAVFVDGSTLQIRLISGNNSTSGYYGFRVEEITDQISPENIFIETYEVEYTGKSLKPAFNVWHCTELLPTEYYTLSYSNNKSVGEATVKFVGRNQFEGITATRTFRIIPAYTQLKATVVSSGIKLSWAASKGASGYLLYRNTDGQNVEGEYWTQLKKLSSSTKSYTDKNTNGEHSYSYLLVPYKDVTKNKNTVHYEAHSSHVGPITRLGPVKNLTGEDNVANNTVALKWDALSGAEGYIIYCSENGGDFYETSSTTSTRYTARINGSGKHQFKIVPYKRISGSQQEGAASNVYTTYRLSVPYIDSTANGKKIELHYNYQYVEDQTGIQIYRSTDGGRTWKSAKTVKCGDYVPDQQYSGYVTDNGSKSSGTSYQYRARAYVKDGKKTYYSDWSAVTTTVYLSEPSITSVKTAANGGLNVSWKHVKGAERYLIERYYDGGDGEWSQDTFTYRVTDSGKTHTFRDASATGYGMYQYRVCAVAYNRNEAEDNFAYSDTKFGYVLNVPEIYDLSNAQKGVQLNWNWSDYASGFEIWRSTNYNPETGAGKWSKVKTVSNTYLNDTSATKNGITYTYKIRSYIKENGVTFYSAFSQLWDICKMSPPKLKSLRTRTDSGFDITFNAVKDADAYRVVRYIGESGQNFLVLNDFVDSGEKTYTVSDPEATLDNALYHYEIEAYRKEANGNISTASSHAYGYHYGKPVVMAENAEKGIMVYANVSDSQNTAYGYASYYTIYRSVNGGSYKSLKTVKADRYGYLAYNDTSAKAGKTYSYQVMASGKKAMDAFTARMSDPTDSLLCKPGPKLTGISNSTRGITIQWTTQKNMPAAAGYAIYRSQDNFHYEQIATVGKNVFTYTDNAPVSEEVGFIEENMFYYKIAVIPADAGQPAACSKSQRILFMFAPSINEIWYSDAEGKKAYVDIQYSGYWSGYEIRCKTGSSTKTVKNSPYLTGLKAGREYEVTVRTYLKYDGKTYYSAWSAPYYFGR